MPDMDAVVEEPSMYEQSAMAASVLSPKSSSINSVADIKLSTKLTKSAMFMFGEDANLLGSEEYNSEDDDLQAQYKPSFTFDKEDLEAEVKIVNTSQWSDGQVGADTRHQSETGNRPAK